MRRHLESFLLASWKLGVIKKVASISWLSQLKTQRYPSSIAHSAMNRIGKLSNQSRGVIDAWTLQSGRVAQQTDVEPRKINEDDTKWNGLANEQREEIMESVRRLSHNLCEPISEALNAMSHWCSIDTGCLLSFLRKVVVLVSNVIKAWSHCLYAV